MKKIFSVGFIVLQFGCIGLLLIKTHFQQLVGAPFTFFLTGIALGFWSIYIMRVSKLHITPDVDDKATLVKKGPYRYIRHPMYLGLLITCCGFLLTNVNQFTITIYLILLIVLIAKLLYEERLLQEHFTEYKQYKKQTYRLIPYLF